KIFTYERKWYSRKDLARHRIHGDPDDTSHRGHPLCKFCDERYLDNDELLKHLRRDHYFCHFCDSDGAQEYYSDYEYLREHFREKHFLCEEGRCSTEQFTHAFRTEIDYKAHKTACHSKNRAEARQNRQIDLQFNYAPRHQRRNEGVVSGEDYDEVDRYNRQMRGSRSGSRGGQQNRRGSWRYKREEEDRDVAAAVRASVAAKRQEEKNRVEDKGDSCRPKKEDAKDPEPTVSKRGVKPSSEEPVPKEAVPKAALSQDDFPAIGSPNMNSVPSSSQLAPVKLDEEDFPRLSFSSAPPVVSASLPLSYMATAQKTGFQEEDFPALVSKVRPSSKTVSTLASAWSGGSSKNMARAMTATASQPARKGPPPGSSKASKKSKVAIPGNFQDGSGSVSTQEIRSAPTMVDVSSLLAASNSQTFAKVGKKKKVGTEKLRTVLQEVPAAPHSLEKVDDAEQSSPVTAGPDLLSTSATLVNGHSEKPPLPCRAPKEPPGLKKPSGGGQCLLPQEDFPALGNTGPPRMPPPPGFNSVVLLNSPPPPPGLSVPPSKPPPGFTPIPTTGTSENAPASVKEPKLCQGPYLILENFQQRNIQLIQSIREFLQEDESQFNKFKMYSGQFRQGLISAEQYYKSCQELLGENFNKIFNELLVLLPDTAKQQELLSAYQDLKVKAPAGSSSPSSTRSKKNRKGVWHTEPPSDLDCCVCPTCQQVLTQQDLVSHQALHLEEEEFPSLQAISRIIS
ncbi:PREDICTED: zinc finger protein 598-like, partial [Thamnophis sirtalis]|uniref:Zinc finger protein 598-like n=1 Tax=Thamnophis sirtalis TaxID=35019 RepID=A0A6I9YEW8_9SAUR